MKKLYLTIVYEDHTQKVILLESSRQIGLLLEKQGIERLLLGANEVDQNDRLRINFKWSVTKSALTDGYFVSTLSCKRARAAIVHSVDEILTILEVMMA